jgi:hypothetical protein
MYLVVHFGVLTDRFWEIPYLDKNRTIRNTLKIITHQSTSKLTLYILDSDSVIKKTTKIIKSYFLIREN